MTKPTIGILMLNTQFPRFVGDIGNPETFDFPVKFRTVNCANAASVVFDDPLKLLPDFVKAGHDLIAQGCGALTTSCGFLSLLQTELKAELGVPFASSSLMQLPLIEATLPAGKEAVVLTISKDSLSPNHLRAAGARADTRIMGMPPAGAFAGAILSDQTELDRSACQSEMIAQAQALMTEKTGAIVLECTNMAPYAADIAQATGCPVFSIVSFINWFHAGLAPIAYPQ